MSSGIVTVLQEERLRRNTQKGGGGGAGRTPGSHPDKNSGGAVHKDFLSKELHDTKIVINCNIVWFMINLNEIACLIIR